MTARVPDKETPMDELLPFLTPIPSLLEVWDGQDPYDLFSPEERERILAYGREVDACQQRAWVAARSMPLH